MRRKVSLFYAAAIVTLVSIVAVAISQGINAYIHWQEFKLHERERIVDITGNFRVIVNGKAVKDGFSVRENDTIYFEVEAFPPESVDYINITGVTQNDSRNKPWPILAHGPLANGLFRGQWTIPTDSAGPLELTANVHCFNKQNDKFMLGGNRVGTITK
jgi:hypothetical protein